MKPLGQVRVDRAGRVDGGRAVADRPRADLVRAGGEERDQAEQPVAQGDHPVETRVGDPELLHEDGRLVGLELAELHLDPGREGLDEGLAMSVGRAKGRRSLPRPGDVALADVQQDEDRLLGQEPEPADRLLLVGVELDIADRRALLQRRLQAGEDGLLALVRLALGGGAVTAGLLRAARRGGRPARGRRGGTRCRAGPGRGRDRPSPPDAGSPGPRTRGRRGAARRCRAAGRGVRRAGPRSRHGPRSRRVAPAGRRR